MGWLENVEAGGGTAFLYPGIFVHRLRSSLIFLKIFFKTGMVFIQTNKPKYSPISFFKGNISYEYCN